MEREEKLASETGGSCCVHPLYELKTAKCSNRLNLPPARAKLSAVERAGTDGSGAAPCRQGLKKEDNVSAAFCRRRHAMSLFCVVPRLMSVAVQRRRRA